MKRKRARKPILAVLGIGLAVGFLVSGPEANNAIWSHFGLASLFLIPAVLVGVGLLAGLAVPGWRGWAGLSLGLVIGAIFAEGIGAIVQPDLYYVSSVSGSIFEDAITLIVVASPGFAIGAVVRRLRR